MKGDRMKFSNKPVKKMFSLFVAMVLGVLFLSACAPVAGAQGFVELPDDVRVGITSVVLVAVSWLIVRLVTLIPALKFLDQFRTPLAMAVAAELITLIQNAVPDAFGSIAILALKLILAVVALFLIAEKLKAKGYRFAQ
jgi:membrane protein YdbS with pleckstrin-like domain